MKISRPTTHNVSQSLVLIINQRFWLFYFCMTKYEKVVNSFRSSFLSELFHILKLRTNFLFLTPSSIAYCVNGSNCLNCEKCYWTRWVTCFCNPSYSSGQERHLGFCTVFKNVKKSICSFSENVGKYLEGVFRVGLSPKWVNLDVWLSFVPTGMVRNIWKRVFTVVKSWFSSVLKYHIVQ